MANKIQLRRGLKSALPMLSAGEPAYTTDTRELFVGTGSGNVNMGGSHWYRGTAMSGTSTTANAYSYSACPQVKLNDLYMNTSNGNVYACTKAGSGTSAKWTYQGCMKGPQGATGATGADGEVPTGELMVIFKTLLTNAQGGAQSGYFYTSNLNASHIGSIIYVPAADEWYDGIADVDSEFFNATLRNAKDTANITVYEGEAAIIKIVSSSKALVLMRG